MKLGRGEEPHSCFHHGSRIKGKLVPITCGWGREGVTATQGSAGAVGVVTLCLPPQRLRASWEVPLWQAPLRPSLGHSLIGGYLSFPKLGVLSVVVLT